MIVGVAVDANRKVDTTDVLNYIRGAAAATDSGACGKPEGLQRFPQRMSAPAGCYRARSGGVYEIPGARASLPYRLWVHRQSLFRLDGPVKTLVEARDAARARRRTGTSACLRAFAL